MNFKEYKPIIFVSGKGGVGKSVVSASLAYHLSKIGKKVLLVELGETSFFEKFFQTLLGGKRIEYKPQEVVPNLFISIWDFKVCLKEYVSFYIKSEKIYDVFFGNQIMQKLIRAAPALKELAILGKATSGPRNVGPKMDYDHIIIDSYSTGHHRALLNAPKGITRVIHRGPMSIQSEKMLEVLKEPSLCEQIIVIKPEELPTVEGLELKVNLKNDLGLDSTIVCNQVLEFPLSEEEFKSAVEKSEGSSKEMAVYFSKIFEEQRKSLKEISKVDPNYIIVPFSFSNTDKLRLVDELGESFVREI